MNYNKIINWKGPRLWLKKKKINNKVVKIPKMKNSKKEKLIWFMTNKNWTNKRSSTSISSLVREGSSIGSRSTSEVLIKELLNMNSRKNQFHLFISKPNRFLENLLYIHSLAKFSSKVIWKIKRSCSQIKKMPMKKSLKLSKAYNCKISRKWLL